jgi:hypothetical protein
VVNADALYVYNVFLRFKTRVFARCFFTNYISKKRVRGIGVRNLFLQSRQRVRIINLSPIDSFIQHSYKGKILLFLSINIKPKNWILFENKFNF